MRKLLTTIILFVPSIVLSTPLSDFLIPFAKEDRIAVQIKPYNWKMGIADSDLYSTLLETDIGSFYTQGEVKIDGMGDVELTFSGPRTMVYFLSFSINYSPVLGDKNPLALEELKDKKMKVKTLREQCPQDGTLSYTNVFELTLPKNNKVYAVEQYSAGASGEGTSNYIFFSNIDNLLKKANRIVNCLY
ncbi:hypothetical protein ACWIUH_05885 [Ursidibacter arcticus]